MRRLWLMSCLMAGLPGLFTASSAIAQQQAMPKFSGVSAPFSPVTLSIEGPQSDERSGANPFADVVLDLVITQGSQSWTIPGYFAGCADAADSGCTGGRIWRAHFLPPAKGDYAWRVRFRSGADVAIGNGNGAALPGDGMKGSFTVAGTQADPVRKRGVLHYTGDPYYRFSGDNSLFFKIGPDAPENTLAYSGFDATPNAKKLRKDWAPHLRDYDARTGKTYLWGKGKQQGKAILGMFRYLADAKLNTVSMLLWNTGGDDRNVFPHLLAVDEVRYAAMEPREQWSAGVVQDRFDLSKLAQWQRAFEYADSLGLHLHMKLQETENDRFMDGGALDRTRKLYLREMVARFGHYLSLTWNLGEENVQNPGDLRMMSAWVDGLDAYDRPIVLHSYPDQKERYRPYLGEGSALNGLSLQGQNDTFDDVRPDLIKWRDLSAAHGRHWVLGYDEPGSARGGAGVDADYPDAQLPSERKLSIDRRIYRRDVIWNTLLAGGNGVEAYYGYQTGCTDLDCQDHRTRAQLWRDGVIARDFFTRHVGDAAIGMRAYDEATPAKDDRIFAEPGQMFVIMPGEKPVEFLLPEQAGRFSVRWFDMINGGDLQTGEKAEIALGGGRVAIGAPPVGGSGEWVALVRRMDGDIIRVEAESFVSQEKDDVRRWYVVKSDMPQTPTPDPDPSHHATASGGAYVEILPDTRTRHADKLIRGENFTEDAGSMGVLSYDVDFPSAGRWYVWVRVHATGTEDNGLHVGLNGQWPASGRRIQYCEGRGQWFWDSRQRTEAQHCGVPGAIWLDVPSAGKHRVQFSMREDGFEFDAFVLTRDSLPQRALIEENAAAAPKRPADH